MRVALLLWAALVGVAGCGPPPAPAPAGVSVTVQRGSVSRTVSATGALSGVTPSGPGSVAVVPFQESDASTIQPGQQVRASFDAMPGVELSGTVLAVAPNAVNISGVTSYYITIVLGAGDPRLRAGQTVRAAVTTAEVDNVLVVPNSATVRDGPWWFVNAPGPDGQRVRVEFVPGLVGDSVTQVLSGLREGQQVLMTH